MNYCADCGAPVVLQAVGSDDRERFVCSACGRTHYQNPRVLVAVYACCGERMLWIRRGTRPAVGKWAMPGGYMETGETPEAAAARELGEETGIAAAPGDMVLVSVSSILHMAQTHLVFRCHFATAPDPVPTAEAPEARWFGEADLPWEALAFPTIEPHVRQLYGWLRTGRFGIRIGFIGTDDSQYRVYRLAAAPEEGA